MAKKPRSQRRKKGSALGEQDDGPDVDVENLSEDHTVADSISTFDDFDGSFDDVEEILETGGTSSTAVAAAALRQARLMDALTAWTN